MFNVCHTLTSFPKGNFPISSSECAGLEKTSDRSLPTVAEMDQSVDATIWSPRNGGSSKTVQPKTIVVTSLVDDAGQFTVAANGKTAQATTLRCALIHATKGTTIEFQAGLSGVIDLSSRGNLGTLFLDCDVTIQGPQDNSITIQGGRVAGSLANARILEVGFGVTASLKNLQMRHGYSQTDGGAILNRGNLTVYRCNFVGNVANQKGGAIAVTAGCNLQVEESTFTNNRANEGGALSLRGTATVANCRFTENQAEDLGGAIYDQGRASTYTNCTVSQNQAVIGGGIWNEANSKLVLKNSLLMNNQGGDLSGSTAAKASTNNWIEVDHSAIIQPKSTIHEFILETVYVPAHSARTGVNFRAATIH